MQTPSNVSKSIGIVTVFALVALLTGTVGAPANAVAFLPASVGITASPATICSGQSARLTWSSTDATSLSIDQGIGSVLPFGDRDVSPTHTTTYTITGTNSTGGHAVASATVYVSGSCTTPTPYPTWTPAPAPYLSCSPSVQSARSGEWVTFSANYYSAGYTGGSLTWNAVGGSPSHGTGSTFGTRFYTSSINTTQLVTVSDGYRSATCTVRIHGEPTPTPYPQTLRCSPSTTNADSGDRVTFRAYGGDGSYSWYAPEGSPIRGYDDTFQTRFYNNSWYSQYKYVTVTSGWQTATCSVRLDGDYWTPTPTPYNTLRCSVNVSTADSGERVTFRAYGGDGSYSWYAADGSPTRGSNSTFSTRFYGSNWYSQYRSATVTSGWQTATCSVLIDGTYVTPYPTPYPTWYPTPTAYPYVIGNLTLTETGRNVSRGQTGEYASVTARGGDTLDLIIRVRANNSTSLTNTYVTAFLPAGLTYIPGSTTLNGYVVGDGVTSSGINVGTVNSATHTTVKLSVRVESSAVPSWGAVTVNTSAQARADGVGTTSVSLPITLGTNASIAAVSSVQTGPTDSLWAALLMAFLVTGAYALYTRSDIFGRRMALAEVARLSRSANLNFSK